MSLPRIALPCRVVAVFLILSCVAVPARGQIDTEEIAVQNAFPNLSFVNPVDMAADGQGYLYVVERDGRIRTFPNDSTASDTALFLDITDRVYRTSSEQEVGLLGLAFHPDYAENGYFYVYYTADDPLRSVVERYRRSDDTPMEADSTSAFEILTVAQPTPRHNAGDMAFDAEGYLLVALGDGSMGADAFNNAQNLGTLLGSIIRIDVDLPDPGRNYGIPPDNPLVGNTSGYREEIYAYGLRNPWRFSIDPATGGLWVGDVGEVSWEEISYVEAGGNYGWSTVEGPACFQPSIDCMRDNLVPPVYAYEHDVGVSVIGGFVYQGAAVPELRGAYVFADWQNQHLYALSYSGDDPLAADADVQVTELLDSRRFVSSFAEDENGELYMLSTFSRGDILRFRASTGLAVEPPERPESADFTIDLIGPNPFERQTRLRVNVPYLGRLRVSAYDLLGREVDVLFDRFVASESAVTLSFGADSLPSGMYVIRAAIGDQVRTEEVIRIR